ncbi:MAG: right-handed parallel beta-helix repeat-containing protein [Candidatus Coatesbacteria bacterium]|nr:right-handed parallel beta-helix repeat-containing protein [Candidatus Coatesbacteria bacterium]
MAGYHTRALVITLILSLLVGTTLMGDTLLVPDDFSTIQAAIDASSAGDTVFVAESETSYKGNIELKPGITLEGADAETTTIEGDNYYHAVVMADNTTIRGLTVMGNPSCIYSISEGVLVENCSFLGHYYDVQVEAGSVDILNCEMIGAPPFIALYCLGSIVTVENCDILGAYAGMKFEDCQVEVYRCVVQGTDNGINVESCSGSIFNSYVLDNKFDGVHLRDSDGFIVANNVIYGSGYPLLRGVLCFDLGPIIANNIIADCRFGIMAGPNAAPMVLYNDVYDCADGNYVDFYENDFLPSPGIGEMSLDPLFADAANDDFTLLEGSPCIDAGYTTDSYKDADGSATDLGAHGGPYAGWMGQSQPPRIKVVTNRELIGPGDEDPFVISVIYSNTSGRTVEADRYVAVLADFGLFYLPWLSSEPMAQRIYIESSQEDTTADILSIDDMLTIPVGEYIFYAAIAKPDTFEYYSAISSCVVERVNNPVAKFTVTPSSGSIGQMFECDASGSYDVEDPASLLRTRWDWENDGTWDVDWSTKKKVDHAYGTPGTKTIALEVRDMDGYIGSTTRQITVTE